MDVILLINYDGLGQAGDIVTVKPGFARNKLIPEGIALRASKRNLAISKERRKTEKSRQLREENLQKELQKKLTNLEITIEAKVGEEDKMFGSITDIDIHKAISEKGFELDRKAILLDEPIKALGIYHVSISVGPDISSDIKIYVIKS